MSQVNPVGPIPSVDSCLVGALLYCDHDSAGAVLELVHDDDVESVALATVLGALRRLALSGTPCSPQLVLAELQRTGEIRRHNGVGGELQRAVTAGADPLAAWHYAAAVVSASLRRRVESAGAALTSAAVTAAEGELTPLVVRSAESVRQCAERLDRLRGETR